MSQMYQDGDNRQIETECRMFKDCVFWMVLLLNLAVKPRALCSETMAVPKQYNTSGHYMLLYTPNIQEIVVLIN